MSDREAYAAFQRWLSAWNAYLFGRMPDPRVAEARRQQQAVAGDVHSRKVTGRCQCRECVRDDQYAAAALLFSRGLFGGAALAAIAASSENGSYDVVEVEHG